MKRFSSTLVGKSLHEPVSLDQLQDCNRPIARLQSFPLNRLHRFSRLSGKLEVLFFWCMEINLLDEFT